MNLGAYDDACNDPDCDACDGPRAHVCRTDQRLCRVCNYSPLSMTDEEWQGWCESLDIDPHLSTAAEPDETQPFAAMAGDEDAR